MSAEYVTDETKRNYAHEALVDAQIGKAQHSGFIDLGDCVHDGLVIDVVRMVEILKRDWGAIPEGDRHKIVVVLPAQCEVELKREAPLVCFRENCVEHEQELVGDGEVDVAVDEFSHGPEPTGAAA